MEKENISFRIHAATGSRSAAAKNKKCGDRGERSVALKVSFPFKVDENDGRHWVSRGGAKKNNAANAAS